MKSIQTIRLILLIAVLGALFPVAIFVWDWVQVATSVEINWSQTKYRGYDWVQWEFEEGRIRAVYVFPSGTAQAAGIRANDILTELDFQPFFDAESFKTAIDGIQPGTTHRYTILRNNQTFSADVRFTAYPVFLYPLTQSLWWVSVWGFFVTTMIHVMALGIIAPLRERSRFARVSLWLILASSVAVFGNFIRILMLSFFGANELTAFPDLVFQALTLITVLGWIFFPTMLLFKVLYDREVLYRSLGRFKWLIFLPSVFFAAVALTTFSLGSVGPLPFKSILSPVLYFVYFYLAAATGLYLWLPDRYGAPAHQDDIPNWSRVGSMTIAVISALMALMVLAISRIVPVLEFSDTFSGWIIVLAQLITTAPILLVSLATLRYGKVDEVISRYLSYVLALGLVFVLFLFGMNVLEPLFGSVSPNIVAGVWMIFLILAFQWLGDTLQRSVNRLIASDKQAVHRKLIRFGEQMLSIVDLKTLADTTLKKILDAMQAESGVLFLHPPSTLDQWATSVVQHHPPYFTDVQIPFFGQAFASGDEIWSDNPALNERDVPRNVRDALRKLNMALVVPIPGNQHTMGLLMLSDKKRYRKVFNLSDLELLRTFCGQIGLANERIALIEREKALIKQHAEAQLVALRAQINPHFLFNALNTLAALIDENPKEAERNVQHLAAIFRYVLQTGSKTFATLSEEFSLVGHYLSIEQTRFGEDLRIEQVLDEAACPALIPAFAVQTLVENAIKHGLEKNRRRGTLTLKGHLRADGFTEITVHDTGLGIPALYEQTTETQSPQAFFGTGLQNVSDRLIRLYGRDDLLRFQSHAGTGTTVRLLIPKAQTPNTYA